MNLQVADQIAKAVLYEGYMLYPYRPSSVKNHQRFNFGVLFPAEYCALQAADEVCSLQAECLVSGDARIEARLRFLQLQTRTASPRTSSLPNGWQEAVEREVILPSQPVGDLCQQGVKHEFVFEGDDLFPRQAVAGTIEMSAAAMRPGIFKITLYVRNTTELEEVPASRDAALQFALVSTHVILGSEPGGFVSLLDPPDDLREAAAGCQNSGVWPVLVGESGSRETLMASPIILYDYPQIAPESAGDLFDGTEIDEILSLRIMTLTDDEKNEIRRSDDRAREILERTENMPVEQFMKLHGAVRGLRPVKEEGA
jgi:hypothetical protein